MKLRQGAVFGIAIGVLVAGFGGTAAFAATPSIPDANGIIRACVKTWHINQYKETRWINRTYCNSGEKLIAWNYKGRTGATGPKGATGPQGPAGPAGADGTAADLDAIQVVTNTVNPAPNLTTWTVTATCPDDTRVIAGGGNAVGSFRAHMARSSPADAVVGGNPGWTASWAADDTVGLTLSSVTAYATCVPD